MISNELEEELTLLNTTDLHMLMGMVASRLGISWAYFNRTDAQLAWFNYCEDIPMSDQDWEVISKSDEWMGIFDGPAIDIAVANVNKAVKNYLKKSRSL